MNDEFDKIDFKGKKYYLVGCSKCSMSDWKIASNGRIFVCSCINCGHRIEITEASLRNKPEECFDMRFFQ